MMKEECFHYTKHIRQKLLIPCRIILHRGGILSNSIINAEIDIQT
jgi:hypothetical protein